MVLAVIPARGGSKGIPRKNVRLMHGKPLIYYSIQNARACSCIDDVVVSSDDLKHCSDVWRKSDESRQCTGTGCSHIGSGYL